MSLATFKRLIYPEMIVTTGFSTSSLTATNNKYIAILTAPKTGNITHVNFRTVSVSAPETIQIRLETIDSSGVPTGTLINANATGSQTSPVANTNYETALTGSVPVTKGQLFAVVFSCPSGTPNVQFSRLTTPYASMTNFPYAASFNGTVWTKLANVPIIALKYDDNTYPYLDGCYPPMVMSATNFNTTTAAFDEAGNLFTVPFQCRVVGTWTYVATAAGTFDSVIYDSSDNVLASSTDLLNQALVVSGASRMNLFNTPIILEPNTQYRVTTKSTNTTNVSTRFLTFDSTAIQEVTGVQDFTYTQRKGSGAWTDTANKRALIGLVIDQVNESGSTGKFKIMTAGGLVDIS